jgi:hypothetical protein
MGVLMENYKGDIEHSFDKRSRIEAIKYPELNGSDEVFDSQKKEFIKLPPEQHKRIKYGFYQANIISQLRPKATHLYIIILLNTDKYQKTYIQNETLSQLSGLSIREISKGNKGNDSLLNELEYWHLIERRELPNPKYKKNKPRKNRCITVHRWDTAKKLLLKEGKMTQIEGKYIINANPYNNK